MADKDFRAARGEADLGWWEEVGRYLDGRCTPAEAARVEAWLAEDPARRELVRRIERARLATTAAPGLWGVQSAWSRFTERVGAAEPVVAAQVAARSEQAPPHNAAEAAPSAPVLPLRPARSAAALAHRRWWGSARTSLRAAAMLLLVVGGAFLWQRALVERGTGAVDLVAAGVGERVRFTLADGSEVILGPNSRLSVPKRFGKLREVRLQGEAVFDVATDSARGFRVVTDLAVTQVLGTRFGVRAYPEDGYAEVVVAEGRVAVTAAGAEATSSAASTLLTPGLAVRVTTGGELATPRQLDAERTLGWTEGRLYFDDTPLYEVARTLERRYGVALELADPVVAALRLTAEFRQPTALDLVKLIALSLGLEYRKTQGGYLLSQPAVKS